MDMAKNVAINIDKCRFIRNFARKENRFGGQGGAVYISGNRNLKQKNDYATATLTSNEFINNYAEIYGGALYTERITINGDPKTFSYSGNTIRPLVPLKNDIGTIGNELRWSDAESNVKHNDDDSVWHEDNPHVFKIFDGVSSGKPFNEFNTLKIYDEYGN